MARIDRRKFLEVAGMAGLTLAGMELLANQTVLVIHKDAPHPNAAKLMLDWWLSKEGQEEEVVGVSNRFPVRPDVTVPPFYKGVEVYIASWDTLKQTRQNSALFREIFGVV